MRAATFRIEAMKEPSPRVALIHATALALGPIAAAFERLGPQARRMNLLDAFGPLGSCVPPLDDGR